MQLVIIEILRQNGIVLVSIRIVQVDVVVHHFVQGVPPSGVRHACALPSFFVNKQSQAEQTALCGPHRLTYKLIVTQRQAVFFAEDENARAWHTSIRIEV
jgi:hypothetical protein